MSTAQYDLMTTAIVTCQVEIRGRGISEIQMFQTESVLVLALHHMHLLKKLSACEKLYCEKNPSCLSLNLVKSQNLTIGNNSIEGPRTPISGFKVRKKKVT